MFRSQSIVHLPRFQEENVMKVGRPTRIGVVRDPPALEFSFTKLDTPRRYGGASSEQLFPEDAQNVSWFSSIMRPWPLANI